MCVIAGQGALREPCRNPGQPGHHAGLYIYKLPTAYRLITSKRDTIYHWLIFQDTDKTVRIECVFAADDQTVSFRPTAGSREDGGGISVT